jgi:hypothetical protein
MHDTFDFSICNLYPVESSPGGPPSAAFHRAGLKSAIDFVEVFNCLLKLGFREIIYKFK